MGMMHVKLARYRGAGLVIGADLFETRASRAKALGADIGLVVSGDDLAEQVLQITDGAMADVVIVGPGTTRTLSAGIAAAGKGATVVQFTATPPEEEMLLRPHDLYFNETRLIPSYSSFSTHPNMRGLRPGAKARLAQGCRNFLDCSRYGCHTSIGSRAKEGRAPGRAGQDSAAQDWAAKEDRQCTWNHQRRSADAERPTANVAQVSWRLPMGPRRDRALQNFRAQGWRVLRRVTPGAYWQKW
jgi:hypothetical protein